MVELMAALAIAALLGVYAQRKAVVETEEALAVSSGSYIAAIAAAAQRHTLNNFEAYANGGAIPGVAVALAPTLAELKALGLGLGAGFPANMPTKQVSRIDIGRQNCPGTTCVLTATVCSTTSLTLGRAIVREDLVAAAVQTMGGQGGFSRIGDGATVRGTGFTTANPNGNVEGVLCAQNWIDTSVYNNFVRIRDTRDPDLQGPLTVAGATTLNGPATINNTLNVTGNTTLANLNVGPCVQMDGATGRAGFGCRNRDDLPAGYTGGVRSPDVVADQRVLAANNPAGFAGNNGNFSLMTADDGGGAAAIRTSGRSVGDTLTPTGRYASGAVCTDPGAIAGNVNNAGLLTCHGGFWKILATYGEIDQVCTQDGAIATSTAGASLICTGGIWVSTTLRMGRFAVSESYQVFDGSVFPAPNCPAAAVPKVYFLAAGIDSTEVTPDRSVSNFRIVQVAPGSYTAWIDATIGNVAARGTPQAGYGTVIVGCFYN